MASFASSATTGGARMYTKNQLPNCQILVHAFVLTIDNTDFVGDCHCYCRRLVMGFYKRVPLLSTGCPKVCRFSDLAVCFVLCLANTEATMDSINHYPSIITNFFFLDGGMAMCSSIPAYICGGSPSPCYPIQRPSSSKIIMYNVLRCKSFRQNKTISRFLDLN